MTTRMRRPPPLRLGSAKIQVDDIVAYPRRRLHLSRLQRTMQELMSGARQPHIVVTPDRELQAGRYDYEAVRRLRRVAFRNVRHGWDVVTVEVVADIEAETARRARVGGLKGGHARAANLTAEQRREIARKAARARWASSTP